MSWERDPLYAKAKLFFECAFSQDRDDPVFGLWCSLGLELLARSALASISPTLLAEPDREHKYLLHALNHGLEHIPRKSITALQVFNLCSTLFPGFTKDDYTAGLALINRRNEELHSGAAAFDEYPSGQWLAGLYRVCNSLSAAMGESLTSLFGKEEASFAEKILTENRENVKHKVLSAIAAHKKAFDAKQLDEQAAVRKEAEKLGLVLSTQQHHRVTCPASSCTATVQGRLFGKEHVTHEEDGDIVVRQAVSPTDFSCFACGLKLTTYAELETAGLGNHYTHKTTYSPEDYYGLIDPDNLDSYLADMSGYDEYDNE
jgi:hypothetical protein